MFGAIGFSVFMITYTLGVVIGAEAPPAGTRRYYLSTNQLDTEKAAEECYKMDMTLATERTDEEYEAIGKELQKKDANKQYHTSGHRKSSKEPWIWSDMGDDRITKFHWNKGEPKTAKKNEFCIVTSIRDGKQVWNAVSCSSKRLFICQSKDKAAAAGNVRVDTRSLI